MGQLSLLKTFALNARMRHTDRMDSQNTVSRDPTPPLPRSISDVTARDIAWVIAGMLLAYLMTLI